MSRLGSFAFEPVGSDAPEHVSPYELRALLATGAHGKAYLAFDPTGRPLAVKVYRFGFGADPTARARLLRAVTVARSMRSEIVAPVLGAGFTMHRLWLATVYQPGPSLADAVFRHGPLPRETVRRLALALTGLVGELHLVGLSGRGLEPADVVLTTAGPRVVDLGFARVEGGERPPADAAASAGQAIPGRYASGATVLAQDVRDVGAILYFAATGRVPAVGASDIVSPSVGDCPAALREPIAASLRENPERRPSLAELAAAASTAGVPLGTAAHWESAPWLPERVARDAEERAAAASALRRQDTWRTIGLFPPPQPSSRARSASRVETGLASGPEPAAPSGSGGSGGAGGSGGSAGSSAVPARRLFHRRAPH